MAEFHEKFNDGFEADLDTDMDGLGTTGCWITKGSHTSSLELAEATGELDDCGDTIAVPQEVLDEVRSWAEENGY